MKRLILLLAIACGVTVGAYAQRPEWPAKPIKLLVPFGAGGAADVTARLYAEHLGQAFGQQFVVENRTGGGGLIGAQALMRSEPAWNTPDAVTAFCACREVTIERMSSPSAAILRVENSR